jgi:hypothetical protein
MSHAVMSAVSLLAALLTMAVGIGAVIRKGRLEPATVASMLYDKN